MPWLIITRGACAVSHGPNVRAGMSVNGGSAGLNSRAWVGLNLGLRVLSVLG